MLQAEKKIDTRWQGVKYHKDYCEFRIFAQGSDQVTLAIYDDYKDVFRKEYIMEKEENAFFYKRLEGDLDGKFYTYLVNGNEVTDPNSRACSVNSQKSAIVDLRSTDPEGFRDHQVPYNKWEDAIIYEVHVADFTGDKSSGVDKRGKFLGMAQEGGLYEDLSTGIDHLQELGVSHIHLLPVYDFITVDETKDIVEYPDNYNWGYDPELYNCLEGSYSTNPYDPKNRIFEFKSLVQKLHKKGMSVVMDVVYNHTYKTLDSNFNLLAPNYYHRNIDGFFYNASGCGNEFATEKDIASEFIVNSLLYWVEEYKIDGFRFDLMAIIDIDTIMKAIDKLRKINPNIIIYGEPWMADASLLPLEKQIIIGAQKTKNFAIFNPFYRDALRGDNDGSEIGYVQGAHYLKSEVEFGIAGSVFLDGSQSNFSHPIESINYFNAHDNLIFQDKLIKSNLDPKMYEKVTLMAFSILMMSQGIPFIHAGNEFMRSKKLDHNSYKSSILVNGIDWSLKKEHESLFYTIRDLIKLRKSMRIFNLTRAEDVIEKMTFIKGLDSSIIAYFIREEEKTYLIVHNLGSERAAIKTSGHKNMKLIWSNSFKDELIDQINVESYTSNIYEIRGEINEL
ncbi:MAG: type I pullulanase [Tissierellia bacterium]|nr:type I pullulanase [Tissierellia bacterium]